MIERNGSATIGGYRVSWVWKGSDSIAGPLWHVAGTRATGTQPYAIGVVHPDGRVSVWSHGRSFSREEAKILVEAVRDSLVAQGLATKPKPKKARAAAGSGKGYTRGAHGAPHGSARRYRARFIHKISPKPNDYGHDVYLVRADLQTMSALASALRATKNLSPGERLRDYRVERDGRIVAFPQTGVWHAIVLEPT